MDADRERANRIVEYLLARLRRCCPENISQSEFSRLLYPEIDVTNTRNSRVKSLQRRASLTTAELVDLIDRINKPIKDSSQPSYYQHLVTPEETLALFQKLVQLEPTEKKKLGLPSDIGEVLLQQALLNMRLYQNQRAYEMLLKLYSASISLTPTAEPVLEESIDDICQRIPGILKAQFNYLPPAAGDRFITEVESLVRQQIKKILLKGGTQTTPLWQPHNHNFYAKRYLTLGFVERLTQSIGENQILNDDFPIFIEKITVEDLETLPQSATPTQGTGLFNQDLLNLDRQQPDLVDLAAQSSIRVTLHFSFKRKDGNPINFVLSSQGIGGTISQIVKVINTALLSNIGCLHNFFPIAHDVSLNQEIIQNNISSPVWAHSLVMLCRTDLLSQAMSASSQRQGICFYDEVTFGDSIGRGDCCDFDFLHTIAKAALYARLRAIQQTGITPNTYLEHLCERIDESHRIREAHACLTSYPFSSFAQEGWLRTMLARYWDNNLGLPESAPESFFHAYLLIAETFLEEGMYRRAYGYLRRLQPVLKRRAEQSVRWYRSLNSGSTAVDFENFSGTLLIRYQLCWATYYYLLDRHSERDDPQTRKFWDELPQDADQRSLILKAWNLVNDAEELVTVRLAKYLTVNEISQGTVHPHYHLLAQIYFLRARMLLFFPFLVPIDKHYLPTDAPVTAGQRDLNAICSGWLYLLEKARLYAACDGDQALYACHTSFQSCLYVVAAFLNENLQLGGNTAGSTSNHLHWAKRLRDQALLSYAKTGRDCYYQIKEKSGTSSSLNHSYGRYFIDEIPPIREMANRNEERPGQHDSGILYIDMELLCIPRENCLSVEDNGDPREGIYLFGTWACYPLFARGLYHLCSDDRQEFKTSLRSPVAQTPQDWDEKFSIAYQLFTYAWAMAEDGANLERRPGEEEQFRVRRNFTVQAHPSTGLSSDASISASTAAVEHTSAQVQSVRDLYPHRVTEIADLAKLFMAVSALLRLYVNLEEPTQLRNDMAEPLAHRYREAHCRAAALADQLKGQRRYNGHLETFIEQCVNVLTQEVRQVQPLDESSIDQIRGHRSRLLRSIFAASSGRSI